MGGITRPYDGVDDLRRMQRLVQAAWELRGPNVEWHVGDLAWGTFQHVGREPEWERRLWEEDGELVAYGWLFRPGKLDYQIDPRRPELLDDVLTWFEVAAERRPLETSALAADEAARETLRGAGTSRSGTRPGSRTCSTTSTTSPSRRCRRVRPPGTRPKRAPR